MPAKTVSNGKTYSEPTLSDIIERLDTLVLLLLPPQPSSLGVNGDSLVSQILSFCDYNHTTEEIVAATKKNTSHVAKELSLLRTKGLVKTVKRGNRSVHVRLP